jgi:hypothetical protein
MVDEPASRYPYADDGRIAVPAPSDWLDPMIALSFAAAATSTIGLATGVMLRGARVDAGDRRALASGGIVAPDMSCSERTPERRAARRGGLE